MNIHATISPGSQLNMLKKGGAELVLFIIDMLQKEAQFNI